MAHKALSLADVDAYYGDGHVLQKVSFAVGEGRVLGLIGRNGAGKSTCMNVAVGLLPPRAGRVEVFGVDVARLRARADRRAGRGPRAAGPPGVPEPHGAREPGRRRAHRRKGARPFWTVDTVFEMFPRLKERRNQLASLLSGGEQQMLAIGRALMANPRVLLMDEPSEGLAPQIVADVGRTIAKLKSDGLSIVLVEQNIKLTLELADDITILNSGRVVFTGPAAEIKMDDAIVAQHLGVH